MLCNGLVDYQWIIVPCIYGVFDSLKAILHSFGWGEAVLHLLSHPVPTVNLKIGWVAVTISLQWWKLKHHLPSEIHMPRWWQGQKDQKADPLSPILYPLVLFKGVCYFQVMSPDISGRGST